MADFKWDNYSTDDNSPTFDFEAHEPVEVGPTVAESGVRKLLAGATSGLSDEVSGGLEALGTTVGVKGIGKDFGEQEFSEDGPTLDWEVLKHAYKAQRDAYRKKLKKDSDVNPGVSTSMEFAGALVNPVNKVMPGNLAAQGLAIGGASGFGNSEAETLGGLAKDTGLGMGTGLALGYGAGKASPYIEKGITKLGDGAKNLSEKFAARALGAERGTIKKLGADKVQKAGRQALDEGILSPLASTDDVIARNAAVKSRGGGMMDDVYNQIDDAGASTFNPLEVAGKVDDQIGGFYRTPINKGETNQLENTLESILMRGEGNIPLKEAQALKQELGKVANWKNNLNITEKEKMAREAYKIVSQQIDDAASTGAKSIGKEGLEETLTQGKRLYSNSKTAEELLTNKSAREAGNSMFGLTDTIVGGAGLAYGGTTGDWQTAGGVMLAKKGLQKYGSQNAALVLDKISKSLLKSPQMANLYQKSPAAFQKIVHELEQKSGAFERALPRAADQQDQGASTKPVYDKGALMERTRGSKYAQVLQNAADKSDQSLAAAHFVLAQRDPEYRKLVE